MIASLSGVRALRPAAAPLNLILLGREAGTCSTATEIAFAGARGDVPDDLEYAEVCEVDAPPIDATGVNAVRRAWCVRTARGEFIIHARSMHLHRDVSTALRTILPPQRAPFLRRLAWRWLPTVVASPIGRRLLAAARRS